jgi:hypothetical protein
LYGPNLFQYRVFEQDIMGRRVGPVVHGVMLGKVLDAERLHFQIDEEVDLIQRGVSLFL